MTKAQVTDVETSNMGRRSIWQCFVYLDAVRGPAIRCSSFDRNRAEDRKHRCVAGSVEGGGNRGFAGTLPINAVTVE